MLLIIINLINYFINYIISIILLILLILIKLKEEGSVRSFQACAKFRLRLSSGLRLGVGLVLALEYALDDG